MRVIAGVAKGRPLHAPRGTAVRPTSDKVKGAIFSMLESLLLARLPESDEGYALEEIWAGVRMLDLYAGTGALAIEALSRGAAGADLVEASPAACRVIRRNLAETGLAARARLYCISVQAALGQDSPLRGGNGYGIIALDPPYADSTVGDIVRLLSGCGMLQPAALVVVEHSRRVPLAQQYGTLALVRERTHGETTVSLYRNQEATS